jgi:hypothetical protein
MKYLSIFDVLNFTYGRRNAVRMMLMKFNIIYEWSILRVKSSILLYDWERKNIILGGHVEFDNGGYR